MRIQERVREMKDEAVNAKLSSGLDKAERDRDRLKFENETLKARVSDADDERSRLLDSLESVSKRTRKPKRHRVRRTLVLATAAGSAYVMGSKAGRERYEELKRRWSDLTSKVRSGASVEDTWDAGAPDSVIPAPIPPITDGA